MRDELAEELAERMARADEAHRRRLHNEIAAVEVQTTTFIVNNIRNIVCLFDCD